MDIPPRPPRAGRGLATVGDPAGLSREDNAGEYRGAVDGAAEAIMPERITRRSVTFLHPFSLVGVDGVQPAGTYTVETVEEPLENLSFIAYRRVSTTIVLPSSTTPTVRRQAVIIDPGDLEAAQKIDAGMT
jgi:hypothetical protein